MLPETGGQAAGAVAVALAFIAFIRFFLWRQIEGLRTDIADLRKDFALLKGQYDYQRHRAHHYREHIAKMVSSVDLAAILATQAVVVLRRADDEQLAAVLKTMEPIADVLERLHDETAQIIEAVEREPEGT